MANSGLNKPMAAVGEYETVLPFQAAGVKPFIVNDNSIANLPELLIKLAQENYAVIFIQEKLFVKFTSDVDEINEKFPVSILPIPGLTGSMGTGLQSIKSSVERAVGMDIFSVN